MAGSRALRKLQIGTETTGASGTPVAATAIWRGMGTIHDQREIVFPEEDVGYLGGTSRSYVARYWSELTLDEVEATFEQVGYILAGGISNATASADGTGSGYVYEYIAPTTAQNETITYTIEGGDDQQAEEFDYAFVKSFSLGGEAQGALMMSAEIVGRETSDTTFTAALTLPTVEEIIVNNATLYIDDADSGDSLGGTAVSNTLFGFNLDWTTGLQEYWAVDGSKDFSITKFTTDEIMLSLTYEHNASAVTEKDNYQAGTARQIRIKLEGTDLTTTGTTYSKKTMLIDLAGVYEDWSALDERDGNDVVEATLRTRYHGTANGNSGLKAQITVVNEAASLA